MSERLLLETKEEESVEQRKEVNFSFNFYLQVFVLVVREIGVETE